MMLDVQEFIDHWRSLGYMASRFPSGSQTASELSKLGEKREVWQVFACLIGYAQKELRNMREILAEIPEGISADELAWSAAPFLAYCTNFKTSPIDEFLPAVYFVKAQLSGLTILGCSVITIQRCIDSSGNDPEKFLQCISKGEARHAASSRAYSANETG